MPANRSQALRDFVAAARGSDAFSVEAASADASFRSYWRVREGTASWIVMDAPPAYEDVRPWLAVGARLRAAGLHAPEVFAADDENGFVLMEDLGVRMYLPELSDARVDALYADACDALLRMQTQVDASELPVFDASRTIPEMELLAPWFLERHLGFLPGCTDWDVIENAFRFVAESADEQPRRFMHRDYHSRNLLVVPANNPGIIDFQGAMHGPIAYDLASLLRDCYVAWPAERVDVWVEAYRRRLVAAGLVDVDAARFRRWFDLIGLQRHIKVLGLFCRLCYRDGKAQYLSDLPRVLGYVIDVTNRYPALADFRAVLQRAADGRDLRQPLGTAAIAIA